MKSYVTYQNICPNLKNCWRSDQKAVSKNLIKSLNRPASLSFEVCYSQQPAVDTKLYRSCTLIAAGEWNAQAGLMCLCQLNIRVRWFNFIFQKNFSFVFFSDTLPKLEEWNRFWPFSVRSPANPPCKVTHRPKNTKDFQNFKRENNLTHFFDFFILINFCSQNQITGMQQ